MSEALYVLGFAFDAAGENVVLIRKNRPKWQAGRLNAVGGKIEEDETKIAAMIREFREETGVPTIESDWEQFAIMGNSEFTVYVFSSFNDLNTWASTVTDEEVVICPVSKLREAGPQLGNIIWLTEMALDNFNNDKFSSSITYRKN